MSEYLPVPNFDDEPSADTLSPTPEGIDPPMLTGHELFLLIMRSIVGGNPRAIKARSDYRPHTGKPRHSELRASRHNHRQYRTSYDQSSRT